MGHAISIRPLADETVPAVKALIADAVLEFYGDLDFLPKDREGLLRHYERTGYLKDLDEHAVAYGHGRGIFLVLHEGGMVIGCGGLCRLADGDAELVRPVQGKHRRGFPGTGKRERRKRGLGLTPGPSPAPCAPC